jgi:hypothetical protein
MNNRLTARGTADPEKPVFHQPILVHLLTINNPVFFFLISILIIPCHPLYVFHVLCLSSRCHTILVCISLVPLRALDTAHLILFNLVTKLTFG